VRGAAAKHLGLAEAAVNLIVCHLGNGASMAAIRAGVCVDTTMGLTPLDGLVMGTRSGDVDPALHLHLQNAAGMSAEDVNTMLNKKSGEQCL
jgi:acetate kinase